MEPTTGLEFASSKVIVTEDEAIPSAKTGVVPVIVDVELFAPPT